jgi:uncharacterized membrane protein YjgN (DUF898 family)
MDTRPLQAPQAPAASVRNTLRFEGTASEYFKIWIVNAALTIVTLGIFSAWAKVRTKRYFYGNTFIGTHAFDYHAAPPRILLGRAIAAALLIGYFASAIMAPATRGIWYLLFLVALPWMIKSSLRFAARNTSYRNLRFDFHGTYWGALKAFVLWQLLAAVTLFTTLPLAHRARDYYNINNHSFGQASFNAKIPAGRLYHYYGMAVIFAIASVAVPVLFTAGILNAVNIYAPSMMVTRIATIAALAIFFLGVPTFIGALTFNLALDNTRLGSDFIFESHLSPWRMIWISLSNAAATLLTLGLLYPWARVRRARYMADCITVIGPADIDDFISTPVPSGNAVGEEVASFFDIDFGL